MLNMTIEERNKIVEDNMKLVYFVVNKYFKKRSVKAIKYNHNIDYDDLHQIGAMGLIKAAEKFDESFKCQFSTYAVKCIYGEIFNSMRNSYFTMKMPVKVVAAINEYSRASQDDMSELHSICKKHKLDEFDKMFLYKTLNVGHVNGNKIISSNGLQTEIFDILPADTRVEIETLTEEEVQKLLTVLTQSERQVMEYTINGYNSREIAQKTNRKESTITTLISNARRKIRRKHNNELVS